MGIYFYPSRFYDPWLRRFLQADTIVPEPGNPQAWDRYAYVYNNPLGYKDPSGHAAVCGITKGEGCEDGGYSDTEVLLLNKLPFKKFPRKHQRLLEQAGIYYNIFNPDDEPPLIIPSKQEYEPFYSGIPEGYYLDYETVMDWNQVDWFNLTTNSAGIIGDVALVLTALGLVPVAPAAAVGEAADIIGWLGNFNDVLYNNEISGSTIDSVLYALDETRWQRAVPLLGFITNVIGANEALKEGQQQIGVLKPLPVLSPYPKE